MLKLLLNGINKKSNNDSNTKGSNKMASLTEDRVERIDTAGRYSDGRHAFGLALLVKDSAGGGVRKSWIQRLRIDGKPTQKGLGAYPLVSLTEARARAFVNAQMIEAARYASKQSHAFTSSAPAPMPYYSQHPAMVQATRHVPTFDELANEWLDFQGQGMAETTLVTYQSILRNWQSPAIGDMPVNLIRSEHISAFIKPKWHSNFPTATTALMLTDKIFDYALSESYRADNPVENARRGLGKSRHIVKHAEYIPHGAMRDALFNAIAGCKSGENTKKAFALMVMLGVRDSALTGFEWTDIKENGEGYYLHIPETRKRQKTAAGFKIPLSRQAYRLIMSLERERGQSSIFNIKSRTIGAMLRRNGLPAKPHGTRSTMTTWGQELTDYSQDLLNECLAHNTNTKVQAAYFQSDRLDKRRDVMQDYSDYIMPDADLEEWLSIVAGDGTTYGLV